MLEAAFAGFNSTFISRGGTGMGKTLTVIGSEGKSGLLVHLGGHLCERAATAATSCRGVVSAHIDAAMLEMHGREVGFCRPQVFLPFYDAPFQFVICRLTCLASTAGPFFMTASRMHFGEMCSAFTLTVYLGTLSRMD